MTALRYAAIAILLFVAVISLAAPLILSADYATQFRDAPNSPPSREHWLGTDVLGRDRLARVLHGTRVSLLLAPFAAFIATCLAALIGGVGGYRGRAWERIASTVIDLVLSLPWIFLLITARALLPLNASPTVTIATTFLLLGALGWAASAKVVCAHAAALRNSDFVLQARALGVPEWRIAIRHVIPNLRTILLAQFWISIPVFILAEANLGILGLGVPEPTPSWGSLLRELEDLALAPHEVWKLAALGLLVLVVSSFQFLMPRSEVRA
jgi:ABC-type dipeptide/oligopeptide/nickel transport system permease subunit